MNEDLPQKQRGKESSMPMASTVSDFHQWRLEPSVSRERVVSFTTVYTMLSASAI